MNDCRRDPESYRQIAAAMRIPDARVLFVSDAGAELDARGQPACKRGSAFAPGNPPLLLRHGHAEIRTFDELAVTQRRWLRSPARYQDEKGHQP
jgi:methionine salvage enolase-phosphatase E1